MEPAKRPQARHWCITVNNYDEFDIEKFANADLFVYSIYGEEIGPVDGVPHLQAYIACHKQTYLTTLKKIWPRAHFEIARGQPSQNRDYCSKDGIFTEFGVLPQDGGQATKKNWEEAKLLATMGQLDSIQASIYIPYIKNLEYIARIHDQIPDDLDMLDNEWHWGPTGTGKSRHCRVTYPTAFIKSADTEWWDGYEGQDVVIIEDLDKYHVKLGYHLKIWSDHYPFPANKKGLAARLIRPKKIIVTSNYDISHIWTDVQTIEPLVRRFQVIEYKKKQVLDCDNGLLTSHFDGDVYTISQ